MIRVTYNWRYGWTGPRGALGAVGPMWRVDVVRAPDGGLLVHDRARHALVPAVATSECYPERGVYSLDAFQAQMRGWHHGRAAEVLPA